MNPFLQRIAEVKGKQLCVQLAEEISLDKEKFKIAIETYFLGEQPLSWRAIWVLDKCNDIRLELLKPHIHRMLQYWPAITHGGAKRQTLRILSGHSLPPNQQAVAFDLALKEIQNVLNPAAIRVYAAEIALKIGKNHPELFLELVETIRLGSENAAASYKVTTKRVVKCAVNYLG